MSRRLPKKPRRKRYTERKKYKEKKKETVGHISTGLVAR
jgi:hypothetical protein